MNFLPVAENREYQTIYVTVTAYSSDRRQTDNTPCLTANDFDLCANNQENIVAANFLPFGAKVKFPDLDSDRVYFVQDRMHSRFSDRVDIWMKSKEKAKKFGIKTLRLQIYE
jgi:3D (Asp-Asp-Asp) domain-containing protein